MVMPGSGTVEIMSSQIIVFQTFGASDHRLEIKMEIKPNHLTERREHPSHLEPESAQLWGIKLQHQRPTDTQARPIGSPS